METHAKPYKVTLTGNVNEIANGVDDFFEQHFGRYHHDRAHGDETCNTLGDRWNSLQAFMGAAS